MRERRLCGNCGGELGDFGQHHYYGEADGVFKMLFWCQTPPQGRPTIPSCVAFNPDWKPPRVPITYRVRRWLAHLLDGAADRVRS